MSEPESALPAGLLEVRYRRALRLLPPAYRRVWEEDMVAVFLATVRTDDPDEADYLRDYGRPSWSEVASVALLAVRLRIGTAGAPPRYLAWGAALRLVVVCGFLANAVVAAVNLGVRLWLSGHLPFVPAAPADWSAGMPVDRWQAVLDAGGLIWLPAYVVLVLGHWRVARALAPLAILPSAVAAAGAVAELVVGGGRPYVVTLWSGLLLDVVLVLALTTFAVGHPPVRRRPWLLGLPAGAIAVAAVLLATATTGVPVLFDWSGLCCLAVVAAAAVHALRGSGRSVTWTHAFALMAAAALALRLVTLIDYATLPGALALGLAEAGGVLAVLFPLRRHTRDRLRRLASMPPSTASWSSNTRS